MRQETGEVPEVSFPALRRWLPAVPSPRVLEIGCGAAEDIGEWLADGVGEYVGVDLDETAIAHARARWPGVTFLCADAARLPAEPALSPVEGYAGRFHAVLIRRPDLFAQPGRWQQVFAALPALIQPGGRVIVTLLGAGETTVAREWLVANKLLLLWSEEHLLVAEAAPLTPIRLDADEGAFCDSRSGECFLPPASPLRAQARRVEVGDDHAQD
jgi:SAM-dependent methyltransferase